MNTNFKSEKLLVIPIDTFDNYVNLPVNILEKLHKSKSYKPPYYFLLKTATNLYEYVGVKEFTAENGSIEVPTHIAEYLLSDYVEVKLIKDIPKGKLVKLEPQKESFFNIPDNDKFLETELSKYCLLRDGATFEVMILDEKHPIKIVEMTAQETPKKITRLDVIDIINTDLNVDFINKFEKKQQLEELPQPLPIITPVNNKLEEVCGQAKTEDRVVEGPSQEDLRKARIAFYKKKSEVISESKSDIEL